MSDQFAIFTLGVIVGGFVFTLIDLILKFREEDKRFKEWFDERGRERYEKDEDAG